MPGKSRHGGRKRSSQGKKKKSRQNAPRAVASQQVEARAAEPVSPPEVVTPVENTPEPVSAPATAQRPYVLTELWRITVLAGIMLVILVVLALTLS